MDRTALYLYFSPADFLTYEREQISEIGSDTTRVPFKELQRLLALCGEKRIMATLDDHADIEEVVEGITIHTAVWEALTNIAERTLAETDLKAENERLRKQVSKLESDINEALWERR